MKESGESLRRIQIAARSESSGSKDLDPLQSEEERERSGNETGYWSRDTNKTRESGIELLFTLTRR